MPSVLYEGLAEGSDFLHEMLSVRRRQKSPAAEAADDGEGAAEADIRKALDKMCMVRNGMQSIFTLPIAQLR